jgi:hypothetical protein
VVHSTTQKSLFLRCLGVFLGLTLLAVTSSCVAAVEDSPDPTFVTISTTTEPEEELIPSFEFKDPTVPRLNPGQGLPEPNDTDFGEIDCEEAEYDLCDSGEWACDDIADYCDVGPDNDRGLPDDWDWDSDNR